MSLFKSLREAYKPVKVEFKKPKFEKVSESVLSRFGKKKLNESWQDVRDLSMKDAVEELVLGFKELGYEAEVTGEDEFKVIFDDEELNLVCSLSELDCIGRVDQTRPAGFKVVIKDSEQLIGFFDWRTAIKGAYVVNGMKCAVHLGRDGGIYDYKQWKKAGAEVGDVEKVGESRLISKEDLLARGV